jgi:hypothetical protein
MTPTHADTLEKYTHARTQTRRMATTTTGGDEFIRRPLKDFTPLGGRGMGLPGIGAKNTEKLSAYCTDPYQLLGLYMFFGCDRALFITYLEEKCGVKFVGNATCSKEEIKTKLCDCLDAKWRVINNY